MKNLQGLQEGFADSAGFEGNQLEAVGPGPEVCVAAHSARRGGSSVQGELMGCLPLQKPPLQQMLHLHQKRQLCRQRSGAVVSASVWSSGEQDRTRSSGSLVELELLPPNTYSVKRFEHLSGSPSNLC